MTHVHAQTKVAHGLYSPAGGCFDKANTSMCIPKSVSYTLSSNRTISNLVSVRQRDLALLLRLGKRFVLREAS